MQYGEAADIMDYCPAGRKYEVSQTGSAVEDKAMGWQMEQNVDQKEERKEGGRRKLYQSARPPEDF